MCFVMAGQSVFAGYGEWYDLGSGWRMRIDRGTSKSKPHVHVNNGDEDVAVENLDGTPSHGSSLDDLPKSVKKKVKEHPEYKKKKKHNEKKTNFIFENLDTIRDAIEIGKEVITVGGVVFSISVIIDWITKLGLAALVF